MANQRMNNIVLGIFVISGAVVLVFALYMIGRNQSFFGSNYLVKARFRNVSGLMPGNNVRFSGIQCGTVKSINIINDTTIEVALLINSQTSKYIRTNAQVSIGNEGLMGNKIINIEPQRAAAPPISDGDMLQPVQGKNLNDMLSTLSATNDNATDISFKLKEIVNKINDNTVLWSVLNDTTIPVNLRQTLINVRNASARIDHAAASADELLEGVKNGNGPAGLLLTDNKASGELSEAITHIRMASSEAGNLVKHLDSLVQEVHADASHGNGIAYSLLKDTGIVNRLNASFSNIEKGTAAFNEDMQGLKHNFLLRGYFRKQEKKKIRDSIRHDATTTQ